MRAVRRAGQARVMVSSTNRACDTTGGMFCPTPSVGLGWGGVWGRQGVEAGSYTFCVSLTVFNDLLSALLFSVEIKTRVVNYWRLLQTLHWVLKLRTILLNVSGSHYDNFTRPQRRLNRFLLVIFPFKMQKLCKSISRNTKQAMKILETSMRVCSDRWNEVPIHLRIWA